MKIGPRFKIAKRLGAPIFEKTQTQKFALSEARGGKNKKRRTQMSDYKRQLLEKQKMRLTYGITEKQLRRYVDEAFDKSRTPIIYLMVRLERRLDNVAYRMGLAKTRRLARQMVSHGHLTVNGRKVTIPSYSVKTDDTIAVRNGSRESSLFLSLSETHEPASVPNWLTFDSKKLTGNIKSEPMTDLSELLFDPAQVLEYYSR